MSISNVYVTIPDSETPLSSGTYDFLVYLDDGSGSDSSQLGFCQIASGGTGDGQTTRPNGGTELDSCTASFGAVSLAPGDTISVDTYVASGTPPTITGGSIAAN
jgi:hypothetical protein